MIKVSLSDSICRVQQAQEVLSLWLEATTEDNSTSRLLGSLLTLLDGVPDVMDSAEEELSTIDAQKIARGKA